MKHLGERASALVDNQLDDNSRDLALAHLTRCPECRSAVDGERALKTALKSLRDLSPTPEFVSSLLALAEPGGPLPPQRRPFPATTPTVTGWRVREGSSGHAAGTHELKPRHAVRLAAGGVVSVAALTAVLAALGGPDASSPPADSVVVPSLHEFAVEHARSIGWLPFSEPASVLVPAGQLSDTGP